MLIESKSSSSVAQVGLRSGNGPFPKIGSATFSAHEFSNVFTERGIVQADIASSPLAKRPEKGFAMTSKEETWTILEKLHKMSSDHRDEIHALETRTDSKITDLKTDFLELRRDTREDIKEMKSVMKNLESAVAGVRDWNRNLVIAVVFAAVGIIASLWGMMWSILGTLRAFLP
jgi:hypothetical protein